MEKWSWIMKIYGLVMYACLANRRSHISFWELLISIYLSGQTAEARRSYMGTQALLGLHSSPWHQIPFSHGTAHLNYWCWEMDEFSQNISWHWPLIIMVSKHQQYQKGVTTYRNGPERTKKDWNGHTKIPKQISMGTKTDFNGHRNRPEQTSALTETNFNGNQKR